MLPGRGLSPVMSVVRAEVATDVKRLSIYGNYVGYSTIIVYNFQKSIDNSI